MSDTATSRQEVEAAQRALAQARCEHHDAEHQATSKALEDNRNALLFMLEDLEAAHKKIKQEHQEWLTALDRVEDPIFLHDKQFRILRCNKAYQQCAGIPTHELIGQPYYAVFPKNDAPLACSLRMMEKEEGEEGEEEGEEGEEEGEEEDVLVGDAIYRSRAFAVRDEQGDFLYAMHILENITEKRQADAQLVLFRDLLDQSSDGISIVDPATSRFLDVNEAICRNLGYTRDELLQRGVLDIQTNLRDVAAWQAHVQELRAQGQALLEFETLRKDGRRSPAEASLRYVTAGNRVYIIAVVRDISERKRAEDALKASEAQFKNIVERSFDAIHMLDLEGKFTYSSPVVELISGYRVDEVTGIHFKDFLFEEDIPRAYSAFDEMMSGRVVRGLVLKAKKKDGTLLTMEVNGAPIVQGEKVTGIQLVYRDITERKQAEAKILAVQAELQGLLDAANQSRRALLSVIEDQGRAEVATEHARRAIATLSAVDHHLVHATNEVELLQAICQAIVQQRGYRMAWVGYVQQVENKLVKIITRAGHDEGYLDVAQISWAQTERGMGPGGRAIRSGRTELCQDTANDPRFLPWREAALQRGYAACIALPLKNRDDTVFGTLSVYADEANAFSPNEIILLEEMAGDLAFGVYTLHTRQERDRALLQVQDSLDGTVRAIASMVEMRDPYTAGHQAKVADLAAAIARQMGLPDEQVHAIHLAGVVHDLGKIHIPAEILSKPGRITDVEFSLIKVHPQVGYDILKDIDFPWPIAQMVLQHHERLDGSGYPQGLQGAAILLEARILSVADVVEAICSHRPFRPSLGIEAALAEIAGGRGTHYDPQVVDACMVLFREQGYVFPA